MAEKAFSQSADDWIFSHEIETHLSSKILKIYGYL